MNRLIVLALAVVGGFYLWSRRNRAPMVLTGWSGGATAGLPSVAPPSGAQYLGAVAPQVPPPPGARFSGDASNGNSGSWG